MLHVLCLGWNVLLLDCTDTRAQRRIIRSQMRTVKCVSIRLKGFIMYYWINNMHHLHVCAIKLDNTLTDQCVVMCRTVG